MIGRGAHGQGGVTEAHDPNLAARTPHQRFQNSFFSTNSYVFRVESLFRLWSYILFRPYTGP